MRPRKVSGDLITTVVSDWYPESRTSVPSQSLKATGAWIRPNTFRKMAAARAGVGLGRSRAIIDAMSPPRQLGDLEPKTPPRSARTRPGRSKSYAPFFRVPAHAKSQLY